MIKKIILNYLVLTTLFLICFSSSLQADIIKELFINIIQVDEQSFEVHESIVSQGGTYTLEYRAVAWVDTCKIAHEDSKDSYLLKCPESVDRLALQVIYKPSDAKSGMVQLSRLNDDKNPVEKYKVFTFSGNNTSLEVTLGDTQDKQKVLAMFTKGIFHVLTGIDHLLFLLCLFLLLHGLAKTKWQIVGVFTAFTISHGLIIFVLSYLKISHIFMFVEVLVVLSIVLLAREVLLIDPVNKLGPSLLSSHPALVSFFMGLVHGSAFANVLVSATGSMQNLFIPLLAFNLGVEFSQLTIVFFLYLVVVKIFKNLLNFIHRPALYLSGGFGVYWMFQRLVFL